MITDSGILLLPADRALAQAVADYYERNREHLSEYEPVREKEFYTASGQRRLLELQASLREQKRAYRYYLSPAAQPGLIVGTIALNDVVWGAFLSAFLGFNIDAQYANKGHMTEAVGIITDFAFGELGLHRIEANVMPHNKASLRVLEKCGYHNEGLSKYYLNINGAWRDHVHMVKLNYSMHGERG